VKFIATQVNQICSHTYLNNFTETKIFTRNEFAEVLVLATHLEGKL